MLKNKLMSFIAVALLGLAACSTGESQSNPIEKQGTDIQAKVGEIAPQFSVKDISGKEISLKDQLGKYVVLEWFNAECPYVRKHYDSQNMQKLQKELMDKGVVWMSVISSAPEKQGYADAEGAKAIFEKEQASPSHVLLDPEGKVGRLYGAKTTPHMYVIDTKGQLAYMGAIDSVSSFKQEDIPGATNYVKQAYEELSAGKPVSVSSTKAYGCSVKY